MTKQKVAWLAVLCAVAALPLYYGDPPLAMSHALFWACWAGWFGLSVWNEVRR